MPMQSNPDYFILHMVRPEYPLGVRSLGNALERCDLDGVAELGLDELCSLVVGP